MGWESGGLPWDLELSFGPQVLAPYRGRVGQWPGQSQETLGTWSPLCSL